MLNRKPGQSLARRDLWRI